MALTLGETPREDIRPRASSEWRFHRDIYRARPEVGAIVHGHPPFCTALACARREIPAFHYLVALAGGHDIRCAAYATFGTQELSDAVLAALAGRRGCLLANHGMVTLGPAPAQALDLALEIEGLAEQYWRALQVGPPVLLDPAEMDRSCKSSAATGPHRRALNGQPELHRPAFRPLRPGGRDQLEHGALEAGQVARVSLEHLHRHHLAPAVHRQPERARRQGRLQGRGTRRARSRRPVRFGHRDPAEDHVGKGTWPASGPVRPDSAKPGLLRGAGGGSAAIGPNWPAPRRAAGASRRHQRDALARCPDEPPKSPARRLNRYRRPTRARAGRRL